MKKLIFILAILSTSISAQVKPKIMLNYGTENYKIKKEYLLLPELSVKTGMSYDWKFLTASFDNTFWIKNFGTNGFTPTQSKFDTAITANYKKLKVMLTHTCWHPISTDNVSVTGIYGGGTLLSISYGY
jgi:hypothetical protein